MNRGRWRTLLAAAALAAVGAPLLPLSCARRESSPAAAAPAAAPRSHVSAPVAGLPSGVGYVGVSACAACHADQHRAWQGSDHALAMQEANEQTMLGEFRGTTFEYAGVTSTFFRRDGKFMVTTDGPDGALHDYEIKYTFGVRPLQQYLIEFPGGRLQALGIAWDSRPGDSGGQRWFHLYPGQRITHADPLHWTGRNQNWNYMCAACHSTDLRENYDLAADGYSTTWSEIDVSCEECHGPGSRHVTWAAGQKSPGGDLDGKGLVVPLKAAEGGGWTLRQPRDTSKHWAGPPRTQVELETCAACHSRRRPISAPDAPGGRFLDHYAPALLEEGLYYPDGQIMEEVYEYASFLQSKMYREGVTCSDCHDPHSLGRRAEGNALCTECHASETFDTAAHHHHRPGSEGASCVGCHMPARLYMVIDPRRDHSFRVPRPDLTLAYKTPNACTQCHTGRSDRWAADAVNRWYGPRRDPAPPFVAALDAGRAGRVQAEGALTALIADRTGQPGIARATALSLLPEYLTAASLPAAEAALADADPLVQSAAVKALASLPFPERARRLAAMLGDPVRAVRLEAARALAASPEGVLSQAEMETLKDGLAELVAAELVTAERPESHVNLALLHAEQGRLDQAESELGTALRLDPKFVPALVNLADVYRVRNREADAERVLERAMEAAPDAAEPIHALGLLQVRQGRSREAIDLLARAAELQPGSARFNYVYGVALHSSGEVGKGIAVLERAHALHPADRDILTALITMERDRGDLQEALQYAGELTRLLPDNPAAAALMEELRRGGQGKEAADSK